MGNHPHEIHALMPNKYGLAVVDVGQLLVYLADGFDLELAIGNSAIDTVSLNSLDAALNDIGRVRALNATGNARAYWDTEGN